MQYQLKNSTRLLSLIICGAIFFIGALNSANAAVIVDASSNAAAFDGTGVTTLTWTHTVGAGASRALFVGVSTSATAVFPTARVTSVTFGAQTLTRVTNGFRASPDLQNAVELFVLVNPTSGVNTITVSLAPTTANYAVGGAVSFAGVSQSTPAGAFVSTTNALNTPTNSATIAVSDSTSGDIVLDVIGTSFGAQSVIPVNMTQTRQWRQSTDQPVPPPFYVGAGSTKAGASPTVTMGWTLQFAQNWALGAVAVKAVPGSTAAEVIVSGIVQSNSASARGISGAIVTLVDANGTQRRARTNPFGYFRFLKVPSGATYIISANRKGRTTNPRVIAVTEDTNDIVLQEEPRTPN